MRPTLVCLVVGVLGLLAAAALGAGGAAVMPAYLAAWLFWLGLPLGALALLMGMEALGLGGLPVAGALRLVLLPLPVAAVLAVPVLLAWPHMFAHARTGFAAGWYAPGFVLVRDVAFLVVWVAMGLLFLRPGRGRALGAPLLLLHVAMVSIAAGDWAMAAEPGLGSSEFGLVVLAAQCGAALSVAVLIATLAMPARLGRATPPAARRGPAPAGWVPLERAPVGAATMLLCLLGAWVFLQFTQYLVVWSANLPDEITWYQHRGTGLGLAAEWLAGLAIVLALVLLLPRRLGRAAPVVAAVAALVLLVHLLETLWLVVPAWRGAVTLSLADVPALLGIGGLVTGCLLGLAGKPGTELRLGLA